MVRSEARQTWIVMGCLLAAYPVGIAFFDWLTHDWVNLPWQLGGYAVLVLLAALFDRRSRRRRGAGSRPGAPAQRL